MPKSIHRLLRILILFCLLNSIFIVNQVKHIIHHNTKHTSDDRATEQQLLDITICWAVNQIPNKNPENSSPTEEVFLYDFHLPKNEKRKFLTSVMLYDITPKTLLYDSTTVMNIAHFRQMNDFGMKSKCLYRRPSWNDTIATNVVNRSKLDEQRSVIKSTYSKYSFKYPYNPFRNITFTAKDLQNERFTSM